MRQNIQVVVSVVVFRYEDAQLQVFCGSSSSGPMLPEVPVLEEESLESAAFRAVKQEGLKINYLEQLYAFGLPNRKYGQRELSVVYFALLRPDRSLSGREWRDCKDVDDLPFDMKDMVRMALERIRQKFRSEPLVFELLESRFPFSSVEEVYTTVLDREVDRRNFKKKFVASGILVELEEKLKRNVGRPASLFRFDGRKYFDLKKQGIPLNLY